MFRSKRPRQVDSKEVGLELGLVLFKFFLKSEYLHYGYFSDGLPIDIQNLKTAQERYTDLLMSQIPATAKSILDVGCGSGKRRRLCWTRDMPWTVFRPVPCSPTTPKA
ncbi:MAG: hypothetical protein HC842_09440 [Cytophagales bacterium]|nr:hypothetical protein [Cytophagales bacterium]